MTDLTDDQVRAMMEAADAIQALEAERDAALALISELLSCLHRPQPETKPDYWHVSVGKHLAFGQFVSKARTFTAKETP